jgi:hypothetical protein
MVKTEQSVTGYSDYKKNSVHVTYGLKDSNIYTWAV